MVALALLALLMGNCLSCPQMLLAAHQPASAHSCCHPRQTTKANCQNQGLHSFLKADGGSVAPPQIAAAPELQPVLTATIPEVTSAAPDWIPAEPTPPDPLTLNSSFRI